MKKKIAMVLCLVLALSLAGCGRQIAEKSNTTTPPKSEQEIELENEAEKALEAELKNEDKSKVQYYLTIGAENVYSIEYSVLDMEPMGIVQSDAPFEKGKVIILEGLTGCSDLRGLRITAFDEVKNVIWTAEVPNSDNEGFTHLQEDDWNITDLIKQ